MINGKIVALRAIEENDLSQLMEWRNNPVLRKYFRETDEINIVNQKKWFDSVTSKNTLHKMFAIINIETNELMGACGLCYIDWINRSADFSIYLGYDNIYIDDKYSIEAASLLKDYGFNILNLHRLWAEIYSLDEPKKIFFKNLKFKLDGELRETYWHDGIWHNSLFYSFLRSDENN
ncbi:MAG: GNAT family N-acetyltransferase [Campylobacteraceae bacterium]|nr:GNAT family N-acetyltransferase [Campylobacteraceae bacterium]